jgi:hypothetical protein
MSKNQIREAVRRKADLRGLQIEEGLTPSQIERHKGTITGGAVYHNPKFKMAVVPPERMVGGSFGSFMKDFSQNLSGVKPRVQLLRKIQSDNKALSNIKAGKGRGRPRKEVKREEEQEETEDEKEETEDEKEEMSGSGKYRGGAKKAEKLGKMYMKQMMELDPEMKRLVGSGFFDKFVKGLSEFAKGAAYPVKAISKGLDLVPFVPNPLKPIASALKDVDDPLIAKDLGIALKTKGRGRGRPKKMIGSGTPLEQTLQVANPNVVGKGMNTKEFVNVPLQQISRKVRGGVSMTIKEAIPIPSKREAERRGEKEMKGGKRRQSPWISFVKDYAKKHNMKYSDALKEAGKHYKK